MDRSGCQRAGQRLRDHSGPRSVNTRAQCRRGLSSAGAGLRWRDAVITDGSGARADARLGNATKRGEDRVEAFLPRPLRREVKGLLAGRGVMRPGRQNNLVRSVLVVMGAASGPRPMPPTHRPRLWAMTLRVIQAALAENRPDGRWLRPTPYFRSLMTSSTTAWRRWSASRYRVPPSRLVMKE
jgi:hypothetical protein